MTEEVVPFVVQFVTGLGAEIGAGAIRSFLGGRAKAVDRAIAAASIRFSEIEGVKPALERWAASDGFVRFCERIHAGERGLDREIVRSFLQDGQFYLLMVRSVQGSQGRSSPSSSANF